MKQCRKICTRKSHANKEREKEKEKKGFEQNKVFNERARKLHQTWLFSIYNFLIRWHHENKERMFNNQEMFWRRKMWTKWRPQCRVQLKVTFDCQKLDTIVCRVQSKATIVYRVRSKETFDCRVQLKATFDCQSLDTIFLCSSTPDVPSVVSPETEVLSSNPISIRIRSDNKITCTGSKSGIVVFQFCYFKKL